MAWRNELERVRPLLGDESALVDAIEKLFARDKHLLEFGCSERSVAHRLAVYLEDKFDGYQVDCEYNRNGTLPKNIPVLKKNETTGSIEESESSVYPDIIVHNRGNNRANRLIIEMKISGKGSQNDRDWDFQKLKAFKFPEGTYAYTTAVFLEIGWNKDLKVPTLTCEVIT